jgi:competence protein ComEC
LRTPLRWSGVALVLFATLWAARVPQPDILVSADGRHVGVRGQDGRLQLMQAAKGSKDAFLVREWLAGDADARTADDATLGAGVSCDDNGCVTASAGGALVAWALKPEALADDCERAALIVTMRQPPAGCAASVIDTERLRRQGALSLRRGRDGFVVGAVKPGGIDRPWSKAIAEDGETDSAVLAPRKPSPRTVDATPADADLQAEE